jgi:hypothetical protein
MWPPYKREKKSKAKVHEETKMRVADAVRYATHVVRGIQRPGHGFGSARRSAQEDVNSQLALSFMAVFRRVLNETGLEAGDAWQKGDDARERENSKYDRYAMTSNLKADDFARVMDIIADPKAHADYRIGDGTDDAVKSVARFRKSVKTFWFAYARHMVLNEGDKPFRARMRTHLKVIFAKAKTWSGDKRKPEALHADFLRQTDAIVASYTVDVNGAVARSQAARARKAERKLYTPNDELTVTRFTAQECAQNIIWRNPTTGTNVRMVLIQSTKPLEQIKPEYDTTDGDEEERGVEFYDQAAFDLALREPAFGIRKKKSTWTETARASEKAEKAEKAKKAAAAKAKKAAAAQAKADAAAATKAARAAAAAREEQMAAERAEAEKPADATDDEIGRHIRRIVAKYPEAATIALVFHKVHADNISRMYDILSTQGERQSVQWRIVVYGRATEIATLQDRGILIGGTYQYETPTCSEQLDTFGKEPPEGVSLVCPVRFLIGLRDLTSTTQFDDRCGTARYEGHTDVGLYGLGSRREKRDDSVRQHLQPKYRTYASCMAPRMVFAMPDKDVRVGDHRTFIRSLVAVATCKRFDRAVITAVDVRGVGVRPYAGFEQRAYYDMVIVTCLLALAYKSNIALITTEEQDAWMQGEIDLIQYNFGYVKRKYRSQAKVAYAHAKAARVEAVRAALKAEDPTGWKGLGMKEKNLRVKARVEEEEEDRRREQRQDFEEEEEEDRRREQRQDFEEEQDQLLSQAYEREQWNEQQDQDDLIGRHFDRDPDRNATNIQKIARGHLVRRKTREQAKILADDRYVQRVADEWDEHVPARGATELNGSPARAKGQVVKMFGAFYEVRGETRACSTYNEDCLAAAIERHREKGISVEFLTVKKLAGTTAEKTAYTKKHGRKHPPHHGTDHQYPEALYYHCNAKGEVLVEAVVDGKVKAYKTAEQQKQAQDGAQKIYVLCEV